MNIDTVLSYLVYPAKVIPAEDQHTIAGTMIPPAGNLYNVLLEVFTHSDSECDIPIAFSPTNGSQVNDCRNEIVDLMDKRDESTGRKLAQRLQAVTTKRSGLGLLFLILGRSGSETKLLISRFPADQGIIAEQKLATLTVEFVEQIFLKNARSYKAALYEVASVDR